MASLARLCREIVRRTAPPEEQPDPTPARLPELLARFFDRQRLVIDCLAPRVAVFTTRRSGKSTTVPGILFDRAEKHRRCIHYYIHPDGGKRAKETLWHEVTELNRVFELGWHTNETTGTLSRPDGTEIRLRGADDVRAVEKLRGDMRPVATVVIDEAQNFPDGLLRKLVEGVLGPALADVKGQLFLCGTPGVVCAGLWWEVTRNEDADSQAKRDPEWTVVSWSCLENPHRRENLADEIVRKVTKAVKVSAAALRSLLLSVAGPSLGERFAQHDPTLLREFFARWVNDARALFYAYDARRNTFNGTLPRGHTWIKFLGADVGFTDDFAYVVWAASATHPVIYELESFSQPGLLPDEWRDKLADAIKRHNPVASVVDEAGGGAKGLAEQWRIKDGLPIQPAEKAHKGVAVLLFNNDLKRGHVKTQPGSPLSNVLGSLRKDPNAEPGKPVTEDPTQPNHASDAGLYGYREAYRFMGRADEPEPEPGSAEARAREEAAELAEVAASARRSGYDELQNPGGAHDD